MKLCQFEIDLLRDLNGEKVPGMAWGGAMGAALGPLTRAGYLRREMRGDGLHYVITDQAKAFLASPPVPELAIPTT